MRSSINVEIVSVIRISSIYTNAYNVTGWRMIVFAGYKAKLS